MLCLSWGGPHNAAGADGKRVLCHAITLAGAVLWVYQAGRLTAGKDMMM